MLVTFMACNALSLIWICVNCGNVSYMSYFLITNMYKMSNIKEFLNYVAGKLGTSQYQCGGYQVIIGGEFFSDFSTHPQERIYFPQSNIYSTAAGRYLLPYKYWRQYKAELKLNDFSPSSQDEIVVKLIEDFEALDDVDAGLYDKAIEKCRSIWLELPAEISVEI